MVDWGKRGRVAQNVFEAIGLTPMLKLNKVTAGISADVLVKLEWFSPTGSLKDRIYYRMITEAIKQGESVVFLKRVAACRDRDSDILRS